jgi:hypothetical protein
MELMADTIGDDLAGEIAYVKTLAEEGRNAPLVGGVFYVVWGGLVSFAAALTYFAESGALALPFVGGLWFWIAVFVVGWGASFSLGWRMGAKPGVMTIGNKTANAAWFAVGIFISLFWIAAILFRSHFSAAGIAVGTVIGMMFPVSFGVYGIAFYATATAARLDWMRGFAFAAWVFSIAALYFIGDARQLLVGAAGSVVCALLPGFILMRREPSAIV